jgi:hypothetical protein
MVALQDREPLGSLFGQGRDPLGLLFGHGKTQEMLRLAGKKKKAHKRKIKLKYPHRWLAPGGLVVLEGYGVL